MDGINGIFFVWAARMEVWALSCSVSGFKHLLGVKSSRAVMPFATTSQQNKHDLFLTLKLIQKNYEG